MDVVLIPLNGSLKYIPLRTFLWIQEMEIVIYREFVPTYGCHLKLAFSVLEKLYVLRRYISSYRAQKKVRKGRVDHSYYWHSQRAILLAEPGRAGIVFRFKQGLLVIWPTFIPNTFTLYLGDQNGELRMFDILVPDVHSRLARLLQGRVSELELAEVVLQENDIFPLHWRAWPVR